MTWHSFLKAPYTFSVDRLRPGGSFCHLAFYHFSMGGGIRLVRAFAHLLGDEVKRLPRKASLTNLRSTIIRETVEQFSTVIIESTAPVPMEINYPLPTVCRINLNANVIMYPGPLCVQDGIIKEVTIKLVEGQVILEISLDEVVQARVITIKGLPYQTILRFNRKPLYDFYLNKEVVVDPGHGGLDGGWRGPVNLWERDMVWKTALELVRILEGFKARVILTRMADENPSWQQRLNKVTPDTFCFISVHEHGAADDSKRGTAVLYNPQCPGNEKLAAIVLDRIITRVKTPGRGIQAEAELTRLGNLPALKLEPVTITNWVDEGLLRNPYFHHKIALATATGIRQYFRAGE